MDRLHLPGNAVQPLVAATGLPHAQARSAGEMAPLLHDTEIAVQAYTRASDAYAANFFEPSVALWALVIAGTAVLAEWLLARRGRGR